MHSINYLYTLVGTADFVYGLTFYAFIGSLVPVIGIRTNNSRGYERQTELFVHAGDLVDSCFVDRGHAGPQVTAKMFSPNFNFHVPM